MGRRHKNDVISKRYLKHDKFRGNIFWQGIFSDSGMVACSEFIRTFYPLEE
jgi:hypothetical protein